jgi:hypothetical protein
MHVLTLDGLTGAYILKHTPLTIPADFYMIRLIQIVLAQWRVA